MSSLTQDEVRAFGDEWVADRVARGLPPYCTDETVLERVAAIVADALRHQNEDGPAPVCRARRRAGAPEVEE